MQTNAHPRGRGPADTPRASAPGSLELWGGIESTVNRVGDTYFDQLERSGHARPERIADLDRIAALGVRALRYPVLWERVAPAGLARPDWSWPDARLARLRDLGVRPIVGLVHHGSGPRDTHLLDPTFPARLARYARLVAERYPWVRDWTPVNEPLTTARFAALYGLWYPHASNNRSFVRALFNQCRAVVLAMQAIRAVIPTARLIQTDDIGKTHSTVRLAYQAEFENQRRWSTFDLLHGRVDASHPLWNYFIGAGITPGELEWFRAHACPPDVIGLNHYLTSERFLDHRLERYPARQHGGNGRDAYADVEAVRVVAGGLAGPGQLVREAWERYGRTVAITEAHLCCTREEQLRWFHGIWRAAAALRGEGVDVRAVTAWSLLGAFDWNSLVTREAGFYEPGAFDLRAPEPRPTALASVLRDLAATGAATHPTVPAPGWWQRPERLFYPAVRVGDRLDDPAPGVNDSPPLLIVGAAGTLGSAVARLCDERGLRRVALTRAACDIRDRGAIVAALRRHQPWAVVNAAGYVRVDDAEREPAACMAANAEGPALLAAACAEFDIPLLAFSSDLVFDGAKGAAYVESDIPAPLNAYGRSKLACERLCLAAHAGALVARTSAFFGPWDAHNFVFLTLRDLAAGRSVVAAADQVVSPTYVPDLVHAALDLLIDGERGIWHLANVGEMSWAALARRVAALAGLDPGRVEARPSAALGQPAARPRRSALASERGWIMPPLDDALERYLGACDLDWRSRDPRARERAA